MFVFAWILIIGSGLHLQTCSAELKLIQAVFRHGNRAPVAPASAYPNDPYLNYTYEPMGYGGLTNKGKLSVYQLGEFLRERYGKFLGPIYSNKLIWFRADKVERIVMTGQLVAAALFPTAESQQWHPTLDWQPIPVWTEPLESDILYNGMFCLNHKKLRARVEKNDQYLQMQQYVNKNLFAYLSKHAGSEIKQITAFFLRQQLHAQEDIGLVLPKWTESVRNSGELDELAVLDLQIQSYTNELKKIMGGVWIREWLDHIENYQTNSTKVKAFMYAAHEINVAGVLNALNSFNQKVPSYSSSVIFELHELDGELFVKVLHKDKDDVRVLSIPGCDEEMCKLDRFKEVVAPVVPDDPIKSCGKIELTLLLSTGDTGNERENSSS